jgi:anti-sigma regulatory factor (Ser/Thr protein kinase)
MVTLSLFADLPQLATIRDFVKEESQKLGLSERAIYDLRLAVDEACSNVIRHAYRGHGGRIEVTIEPVSHGVEVAIRDWGEMFEPAQVPKPDVKAPLEERPLGGLGLFLIYHVMDDVEFRFDQTDGNTLRMVKYFAWRENEN